jgi:hypothetical protein
LERIGLRHAGAWYLIGFLAAVALAPHRHLNSFEDLLSDGPSDSGVFVEGTSPQDPAAGPQWISVRFIDDDPCLACFHNDWSSEPVAILLLSPSFGPTTSTRPLQDFSIPAKSAGPRRSRAPPAFA